MGQGKIVKSLLTPSLLAEIEASGLTLTTTGSSGAATLVGSALNIPQYTGGGGGALFTRFFRASDYITHDPVNTDLGLYSGIGTGTDQSTQIAALMTAVGSAGNAFILWDVICTGHMLIPGSNVYIKAAVKGYHGIKRPAAHTDIVIANATQILGLQADGTTLILPVLGQEGDAYLGGQAQSNITIDGIVVHGAAYNLAVPPGTTGVRGGIRFWGVIDPQIINCTLYDHQCYAAHFANCIRVVFCYNNVRVYAIGAPDGRDGVHINGPSREGRVMHNTFFTSDDAVALNANDGNTGPTGITCPFPIPGDITGLHIISFNFYDNCLRGNRFLSSDKRIESVYCEGNYGKTSISYYLDKFFVGGTIGNTHPGPGKIGVFVLRNDRIRTDVFGDATVKVDADVEVLDIQGAYLSDAYAPVPFVHITGITYSRAKIEVELVDATTTANDLIFDGGIGESMEIHATVARPGLAANAVFNKAGGTLKICEITARVDGFNHLFQKSGGTAEDVVLRGIHRNGTGSFDGVATATVDRLNYAGLITDNEVVGTAPTVVYPAVNPF